MYKNSDNIFNFAYLLRFFPRFEEFLSKLSAGGAKLKMGLVSRNGTIELLST